MRDFVPNQDLKLSDILCVFQGLETAEFGTKDPVAIADDIISNSLNTKTGPSPVKLRPVILL